MRVRPAAPRIAACTEVQRRLADAGYSCPRPLAGPASLGEHEATAESHVPGGALLPDSGRAARQRLREAQGPAVIGHGDWITDNLRWDGNRLLVAFDWDGLVADSEAVIARLAAATYLYPALPTITETSEFLDAYASARGHPFTASELRRCWAAGLWTRAYDAKNQHAAGQPVNCLTKDDARERLSRAGMGTDI